MRKQMYGRKLGRNRAARTALFRSLTRAMVLQGSIVTTAAKARAIIPDLDKLMHIVGHDTVFARRRIGQIVAGDREVINKLFSDYLPLAKAKKSGFTSIAVMPTRKGDSAAMARLTWVELPKMEPKKPNKKAIK